MKNEKYWAQRSRILEQAMLNKSYDYTKNLEKQFDAAIKETEKEIASWYQKFAKNNNITLAEAQKLLNADELKEFHWTVEKYIEYGKKNAVSHKWTKQLKNASARVHITRLESLKIQLQQQAELLHGEQNKALGERLSEIYEKGYYHTAFEIQSGIGVGWVLQGIDHKQIEKVLSRPWALDARTFSDRIWKNKTTLVNNVTNGLTQMIMRGEAPDKAIKMVADKMGVSKWQAGRLVMTESAAFANRARQDCFNDLGVEKYVISETLDKDSCPLCRGLDGKVFAMKEYIVGSTAPPFHPWCRGTAAPWFEDMQGLGERAARDENGKTNRVPGDMKYEDWAKKFIKSPNSSKKPFTNPDPGAIIKGGETKPEPDELEKKFTEFIDGQKDFSDSLKSSLKTSFAKGTSTAKKVYIKHLTPDAIAGAKNSGNFFRSTDDKVYLNAARLETDLRGPATTFFHEFGHLVDFRARGKATRVSRAGPAYLKAIHKDFDDMIAGYMKANKCQKADAYAHFATEMLKDPPLTNQVSDLCGGLSNNKCLGGYGHTSANYWNDSSLAKEAFAHMFECQFDTARRDVMQQYFPTALTEFEKMLGGLV